MKNNICIRYKFAGLFSILSISALHALAAHAHPNSQAASADKPTPAELGAFSTWVEQYARTSGQAARTRMVQEGILLAKKRRVVLSRLIRSDPQQVLAGSVDSAMRQMLPPEVAEQLEIRFSALGDFSVLCPLASLDRPVLQPMRRAVQMNGRMYEAHVFGRRLEQSSLKSVPLNGVMVDGVVALDESVFHEIGSGEKITDEASIIDVRHLAPSATGEQSILAEAGGKQFRFASRQQLKEAEELTEAFEGPGVDVIERPLAAVLKEHLGSGKELRHSPLAVVLPGQVRVLVIRVDFDDKPGDPGYGQYSAPFVQEFMDRQIKPYYLRSSYGAITLNTTVTPQLYRMPHTATDYATRLDAYQLHTHARAAASADYVLSNFDRLVVVFSSLAVVPGSAITWGGLADVGANRVWVNGELDFRVVAHELGHTFGLNHAWLWQVGDGDPISPGGWGVQYADDFDTMGANWGNDSRTDFNPFFKRQLNWIDDRQVQNVTTSGIYRVHRLDGPSATDVVALRASSNGSHTYWIGCRRNFTENLSMQHGTYIIWGDSGASYSYLIDTVTPGRSDRDAALPVDRTLIDPRGKLTITTVAEGGESPDEYIDVQVTFGPPPLITSQSAAETVIAGQPARFNVQASGAVPTAYQWERKSVGSSAWSSLSDDDKYSGSQTASLLVNGETSGMNGDQFRCVLTNSSGGFNCTQPAILTVLDSAPSLEMSLVGNRLVLSWPLAASQFVLESCSDLSEISWIPLTNGISVSGNSLTLSLNADASSAFFRLRK